METAPERRYNWLPDVPDHRDFMFVERMGLPGRLPETVDLRPQCAPVANQGQIGSCTANAIAGLIEFVELADLRAKVSRQPEEFDVGKYCDVSRLFIYYNERLLAGTIASDSGATLRSGMKSLSRWGVCREKTWSYSPAHVLTKPSSAAYREAVEHRISAYLRISSFEAGLRCLAGGAPFVFGMAVFQSFESPEVARTGMIPLPGESEAMIGGHAVMAVGYRMAEQLLIVRNSWGAQWGDNGYFYLPFAYITNLKLAQDLWTLKM